MQVAHVQLSVRAKGVAVADWLVQDPEDRHLEAAPLTLVVCQVRHQRDVAASSASRALCIQQELSWESDLDENLGRELSLNLIDGATLHSATHNTTQGWRFTSPDGWWTATVMPDSFTLETKRYNGWAEFQTRLESLAEAVAKHVGPVIENRVGLRYVNEIVHPEVVSPAGWKGLIDGKLLQSNLLSDLSDTLQAALQVVEIRTSGNHSLVLRHGTQKKPGSEQWQYTIDNDCSRQGARAFSPTEVTATCILLHRLALQAFEMATTADLRKYLEEGAP